MRVVVKREYIGGLIVELPDGRLGHIPDKLLRPFDSRLFPSGTAIEVTVKRLKSEQAGSAWDIRLDPAKHIESRFREAVNQIGKGIPITGTVALVDGDQVLIDVGYGLRALLPPREFSWDILKPLMSAFLKVGQSLDVVIIEVDEVRRRVKVSHRALVPDPFSTFGAHNLLGKQITGVVAEHTNSGYLVELAHQVAGFLHHRQTAGDARLWRIGTSLQVCVTGVDSERRRISLCIAKDASDGTRLLPRDAF